MASPLEFMRQRFRFTLWPTLFTIPALALLIALGTWQLERLQWKTALIAAREAALAAPAVPAPETLEAARALDFHNVTVSGRFDHAKELLIEARDKRDVTGAQIVTPLILADGRILLVNRGFVPESRRAPGTRAEGQVAGTVTLAGILRLAVPPRGLVMPVNQPGFWTYVDIPKMAAADGLDPASLLPYYIEAGPAPNPGGFPIGGQTRIALPNDHLQYALTWYGFAVTLIVIYLVYHYRKPEP